MASAGLEQIPFENLFDQEQFFASPDSGDVDMAVESFFNLPDFPPISFNDQIPATPKPETAAAANGKSAGKAAGKSGKAKASKAKRAETQKQLLSAIMEALAESEDADEPSSPAAAPPPPAKRAKPSSAASAAAASRPLPRLDSAPSNSNSQGSSNPASSSSALLDSFLGQLPQVDMHLDAIIAALDGPAAADAQQQPAAARMGSAPIDSSHSNAQQQQQRQLVRSSSTSSVDSSAAEAAAAAAAALAVGSRKRKASESEVVSSVAPAREAEMARQMRRALGAAILRSEPCPAPSAVIPAPAAPVIATNAPVNKQFVDGPLRLPIRLPAPEVAVSPAGPAPVHAAVARISAAEAATPPYNDSSDDDMAGFGGSPTCGGANAGGDDVDEWMPRSRGRKERQVAGGRIKARSMAERQRRERISEGLQKLRMVVRGHGDTATMLDNACAYVEALQRRVTSLETTMLLHRASCKHPGNGDGVGASGAAESSEPY